MAKSTTQSAPQAEEPKQPANYVRMEARLTVDPELRYGGESGKAFTTCRIADNSGKAPNFFSVIAFEDVAEELAKLGKKGSTIVIVGRLKSRSYEKDGQKRQSVEIVADSIQLP